MTQGAPARRAHAQAPVWRCTRMLRQTTICEVGEVGAGPLGLLCATTNVGSRSSAHRACKHCTLCAAQKRRAGVLFEWWLATGRGEVCVGLGGV